MHDVDLVDYMMNVLLDINEVVYVGYVDVWSVKACGLMIGLLSMCEVMGLNMYIALLDLDWEWE